MSRQDTASPARDRAGTARLLLVESAGAACDRLADQLGPYNEFRVECAATAAAALAAARDRPPDAVLIDAGLPDGGGVELCRLLRRRGLRTPILLLSRSASDREAILGLDAGASDYIARPVALGVLIARLRAQLRCHDRADAPVAIGPYLFCAATKLLVERAGGRKIRLTAKEAATLGYLYRRDGEAVSRRSLMAEVWGYCAAAETHTVETHMYRLRRKLEPDPQHARFLLTVPGGYRLAAAGAADASPL